MGGGGWRSICPYVIIGWFKDVSEEQREKKAIWRYHSGPSSIGIMVDFKRVVDYHREKGYPLRSQNHDELKSSTVGPNSLNDFGKSKIFKNFRITPKLCFALQYIKN